MSNPKVLADFDLTIPTRLGGDNKDTADQTTDWANRGFSPVDDNSFPPLDSRNGPSWIFPEVWYVSLDAVALWCGKGAEIENYQGAYHELTDPSMLCPYSVDTGEPGWVQETWETFGVVGQSHAPVQIGDFWYRSMLMGVQGIPLPCTDWYEFIQNPKTSQTGIKRIISIFEFTEIQAVA